MKTEKFSPEQIKSFEIAKNIETELCLKVPKIIKYEKEYIILEEIEGRHLNEYFSEDLDKYVEISKNIAGDYQKVVTEYFKTENPGDLLEGGRKWLFEKLDQWSQSIIEEELIEKSWVEKLRRMLDDYIKQKGADFFDWAHGNIIGDHIVTNGKGEYLLDLEILPRPGKKYYDFLRSLDWIFLKSDKLNFDDVAGYMKKYLSDFNWEEIKLVFAFRCIGILGCDILKNRDMGKGDFEQKKRDLIRFIKMEY